MFNGKKAVGCLAVLMLGMGMLAGCGASAKLRGEHGTDTWQKERDLDISSRLFFAGSMELRFAKGFCVDYYESPPPTGGIHSGMPHASAAGRMMVYYEGPLRDRQHQDWEENGYRLISMEDGRRYLVVSQDGEVPPDLDRDIVVLRRPLKNIYLVATAVMDMICELDGLGAVGFSGQKADGWSLETVREEMEKGGILYAGKYDSPDYELIASRGCSLAIENNMITHCPEVAEKLESFGIPVFMDSSSYESHPLGRVEWIKLYGVLLGREKEALQAFEEQVKALERVAGKEVSGKTAVFFYITANGTANVRASSDYIPAMIRLAGGQYIPDSRKEAGSGRSSVNMQMEEFYFAAREADYLIYNSTIDGTPESMDDLVRKEKLLEDFKAVREGNVWCTDRDLYQHSMSAGQMIEDICNMLSGEADRQEEIQYLHKLKWEDEDAGR